MVVWIQESTRAARHKIHQGNTGLAGEREASEQTPSEKTATTDNHIVAEAIKRCSTSGKLVWELMLSEFIITSATLASQQVLLDVVDIRIRGKDGLRSPIVTVIWRIENATETNEHREPRY
jgi:hypothetical protein